MAKNVIEFSVKGAVSGAVSAMKKVSASVKKMGKSLATASKWAAASAVALVGFVKIVNDGIDKTAKFATRLGLNVEQLSKMQFVANQAGISTEQFNMATQRMTRRVAEAAKGLGEAKGALIELGIEAKTFQKLDLDKQYEQLAISLNKVEDPAQRLRLAFKLFDSEGTSVLQMLNAGSVAMQKIARDAQFLGLVISKDAAANSEALSDAMGRATGSMKGLSRAIAGELTPIMTGMSNAFANFIANNRVGITSFVTDVILNFFTMIEVVKQVFAGIKKIFTSKEGFSNFLDNLASYMKTMLTMWVAVLIIIVKVIGRGLKAATEVWTGFFEWVGGAMFDLAHGNDVKDFSDTMANTISAAMRSAGAGLADSLKEPLDVFKSAASKVGDIIADTIGINLDEAEAKAKAAIARISEFGTVLLDSTKTKAGEVAAVTSEMVSTMTANVQGKLERLKLSLLTEREEEQLDYELKLLNLATFYEGKTGIESQYRLDKETLEEEHQKKLAGMNKLAITGSFAFAQSIRKRDVEGAISSASDMINSSKASTKTAFKIQKSFALAKAIVTLPSAVLQSFDNGGGYPWGLIPAGIMLATGINNINQIRSQSFSGAAHGGLTNVPRESTYLLQRGERVLSPNQNSDFTSFINGNNGGGQSGGVVINELNISILENVTDGGALIDMDRSEFEELIAEKFIPALDSLDSQGIKPNFASRSDV